MITRNSEEYIHLTEMDPIISDAIIRGIKRVLNSLDVETADQLCNALESAGAKYHKDHSLCMVDGKQYKSATYYRANGIGLIGADEYQLMEASMNGADVALYIDYNCFYEAAYVLWRCVHRSDNEDLVDNFIHDNAFFNKEEIDKISAKVASGELIPR